MKKLMGLFLILALAGCAQSLSEYMEQPQTILRDPHYAKYQESLRAIEHQYLLDEIDYATYLQKKRELDDRYAQEVQEREKKLSEP